MIFDIEDFLFCINSFFTKIRTNLYNCIIDHWSCDSEVCKKKWSVLFSIDKLFFVIERDIKKYRTTFEFTQIFFCYHPTKSFKRFIECMPKLFCDFISPTIGSDTRKAFSSWWYDEFSSKENIFSRIYFKHPVFSHTDIFCRRVIKNICIIF